jgi:RimJ/RimL family protein N-acetyltransferase
MRRIVVGLGDYLWRPLTDSDPDTEFVVRLRNDPRFGRMFYSTSIAPEQHRHFIRAADERDEVNWLVERGGQLIGLASIYHFDKVHRKAECGRTVFVEPRAFLLSWVVTAYVALEVLGLDGVYIETLEENRIIARSMERFGMRREKVLRDHVTRDGRPMNVVVYSGTKEDWHGGKEPVLRAFGRPRLISFEGERAI